MKDYKKSENIEFQDIFQSILRHPWLFIVPLVIVLSVTVAVVMNARTYYQSSALISFATPGETVTGVAGRVDRGALLAQTLAGDNMREIMAIAFPRVREESNPRKYDILSRYLRSRIKMEWGRSRETSKLLTITYLSTDPRSCYNIVRATVTAIKNEIRAANEEELKDGLSFLGKQMEFYKKQLTDLESDIVGLRTELREHLPELSTDERVLVMEVSGRSMVDTAAATEEGGAPTAAELEMNIMRLEHVKEKLEEQLETGEFTLTEEGAEGDTISAGYSQVIANKEMQIMELLSRGYKPAHPTVSRLQAEIDNIKALQGQREAGVLMVQGEEAKARARAEAEAKLEEVEWAIMAMEKQKELMEGEESGVSRYEVAPGETVEDMVTKLRELNNAKDITLKSYVDTRMKLERAELKLRLQEDEKAGLGIRIIQEPEIPRLPLPKKTFPKLMLGFVIAIGAGIGCSFLGSMLDTSFSSVSELREFMNIPVLAPIDPISTHQEAAERRVKRKKIIVGLVIVAIVIQIILGVLM